MTQQHLWCRFFCRFHSTKGFKCIALTCAQFLAFAVATDSSSETRAHIRTLIALDPGPHASSLHHAHSCSAMHNLTNIATHTPSHTPTHTPTHTHTPAPCIHCYTHTHLCILILTLTLTLTPTLGLPLAAQAHTRTHTQTCPGFSHSL